MQGSLIVQRIKLRVLELGIKMSDFYRDCDISSGALSQWKSGATQPSLSSINKIAEYLKIAPAYLLDESADIEYLRRDGEKAQSAANDEKEIAAYLQQIKDDPSTRAMFDLAKGATLEEIKATVAFLKALREQR